jgi:hypothetical protein
MLNPSRVIIISLLVFALSGCTFGQHSAEDIAATVDSMVGTEIAGTLTAMPTATLQPSNTATATFPPTGTPTVVPSAAATETASPFPASNATFAPTWTPFGQAEATDYAADKNNKDDKNAPVLFQNNSGEEIHLIILSPVYQEYYFTRSMQLILPEADYAYRAWIGNKGPFNGTMHITNGDKHVMTFHENKVTFAVP